MTQRRSVLFASASMLAVAAVAAPAFAQQAAAGNQPAGSQPNQVQEVVVTGIRASLQKALQIKKNSDDIVDAISAEDIGKLPDRNVADALQRIPGINTYSAASGEGGFDENDRAGLHGMPPSLTNVTVDGHSVATGDWLILDQYSTVGRSVDLQLLPSQIVDNLVVDKTQNASLLEGGVAGSIDIQTRSPLSLSKPLTVEGSVEGAYNSLDGSVKPQASAMVGWKNADDTFGVIVSGFYQERDSVRYGQQDLGWTQIAAPNACMSGTTNVGTPTLSGNAYSCAKGTLSGGNPIAYNNAKLAQNGTYFPTLIGSELFEQKQTREGGTFAAQWRPNDQFELKLTSFLSSENMSNYNYNYMFDGTSLFDNVAPTSYKVNGNAITSATFPLSKSPGIVADEIVRPNALADSYYVNLDGKYRVNDRLTITAQVGYTRGDGYTPQSPSFEVNGLTGASYAPSGNGYAVSFPNINPQSAAGLANDWAWNDVFKSVDTEYWIQANGDYRIDDGFWKDLLFGFRYDSHTENVQGWDRGCSLGGSPMNCWGSPATPFSAVHPSSYPSGYSSSALGIPGLLVPLGANPNSVVSLINSIPSADQGDAKHTEQAANYYWMGSFKVQETDTAGYVMARFGEDRWRGNIGLRVVDTQENDFVNEPGAQAATTVNAFGAYVVDQVDHTYIDALPSANFTFDIRPNLLFRVAASESMARPDYNALGGAVILTNLNLTGSAGNANLKPIKSDNFDASLEWYYGKLANVSAEVFYYDLQSYVAYGTYQATYLNTQLTKQGGPNVYSQYTISAPVNMTGQVQGFELQWQTPIKYGFGFLANYTYADGEDANGNPIVGDSKDTVNLIGYYEAHGFSARLAYTWRSQVYLGYYEATPETEDQVANLSAAVSYEITPNLTLTASGLNLTNQTLKYYTYNRSMPAAAYDNGTQAYFGVRFKY
jgi:iron complex outermembrane recepter protein